MRILSNKISCLSLVSWTCRWQGGRTGVEGLSSFLKLSYYIEHRAKSWAQFWHTAAFRGDPHSIMFEFPSMIYMTLYKRPDCSLANTHFFPFVFEKLCCLNSTFTRGKTVSRAVESTVPWNKRINLIKKGSLSRHQGPVVYRTDNDIQRINRYPADKW